MTTRRAFYLALARLAHAGTPDAQDALDELVRLGDTILQALNDGDRQRAYDLARDYQGRLLLALALVDYDWDDGGPFA
jgi:hypothetical protein